MKTSMIISSYNRPMQLNLLLRSCQDHWPDCGEIIIIWKADNDDFKKGYGKLINKYKGKWSSFINENEDSYKKNLLFAIRDVQNDYILMNSDDNVFINEVNFKDHESFHNDCVAFSLRLGDNINYCLPAKLEIKKPKLYFGFEKYNIIKNGYICWDWTKCDRRGAYGYPQPYDSNIYCKQWLIDLIKDGNFNNPWSLENWMNQHRDNSKPFMVAFKESKLISIQANTTGQNDNPNMKGNGQSLELLNKKWLDGYRIKTEGIYGMNVKQCHVFYQYEFEKE